MAVVILSNYLLHCLNFEYCFSSSIYTEAHLWEALMFLEVEAGICLTYMQIIFENEGKTHRAKLAVNCCWIHNGELGLHGF